MHLNKMHLQNSPIPWLKMCQTVTDDVIKSTVLINISSAATTFDIISKRALLLSKTQSVQLRFTSVDMHIQGWIIIIVVRNSLQYANEVKQ